MVLGFVLLSWIASEFQPHRWLRACLGALSIVTVGVAAYFVASVGEHLNATAWYSAASRELIDATVAEIEAGNTDRLLAELKRLQSEFQPSYENRARYDKLVDEFVARVKQPE